MGYIGIGCSPYLISFLTVKARIDITNQTETFGYLLAVNALPEQ